MKNAIQHLYIGEDIDLNATRKLLDALISTIAQMEGIMKSNSDYNKGVQDCINLIKK